MGRHERPARTQADQLHHRPRRAARRTADLRQLLLHRAHAVRLHADVLRGDAALRKGGARGREPARRPRAGARTRGRAGAVSAQSRGRAPGAHARVLGYLLERRMDEGAGALKSAATTRRIINTLSQQHPNADTELQYRNPFELLVATILSAQSTDERVNLVTPALFKRYPNAHGLAKASTADLESRIRS